MTHHQLMLAARQKISRALLATRRDMPDTAAVAKREARDMIKRARIIRTGENKND